MSTNPRVQRIAYANAIEADNTVLTPTTELTSHPAANMKDSSRGSVWRTGTVYEVNANRSDRLDFTEAGVARVAILTPGTTYATPTLYAAHVQAAMNAAVGAVNTYTVTYNTGTKKFALARATGAAAFALPWATGAFANRSCGPELGFITTSDDSGATTYTADKQSFQSRHWLDIDLGAESADVVIERDVNDRIDFVEGGVAKVAQVNAGRYTSWASIQTAVALALNSVAGIVNTYYALWPVGTLGSYQFQIGRNSGAATIAFPWITGANSHRSIAAALGFTADDTGATFYNSDATNLYGWPAIGVAILSDHNARSSGLVTLTPSHAVGSNVLTGDEVLRVAFIRSLGVETPVSAQTWELVVEDVQNSDGFFEGRLGLFPYLEPSRSTAQGHAEGYDPLDVVHVSDHGAYFSDDAPDPWTFQGVTHLLSNDDKAALETFQRTVGIGRPFWWFHDARNEPRARTFRVVLLSRLVFRQTPGDGDPPERWTVAWNLVEDMP